nr:FUSC family protein [Galbitalea soli]
MRLATRPPIIQVIKTSIAAIAAWLLSVALLHQPLPIFAAIAALLVVQPSVSQSFARGVERSLGVIAGVALAYGIGALFGRSSVIVLGVIVVALLVAWAFRLSPGSANQIPISAMLVLAIGAQTPGYAVDRIIETVLGALVALVVNAAIAPPVALAPAHLAVQRLVHDCAAALEAVADALTTEQTGEQLDALLARARELRPLRDTAQSAISAGAESLTLNARRGRHRRILERDTELFARLSILVTRIVGMSRTVHDNWDAEVVDDPTVHDIAREMRRAAHDLRIVAGDGDAALPTGPPEPPALTAPLEVLRPHPTQWMLIGSLLEDMRRVREEVLGALDEA